MANIGMAMAAIGAIILVLGAKPWLRSSTGAKPNISRHVERATVGTEREMGQSVPN